VPYYALCRRIREQFWQLKMDAEKQMLASYGAVPSCHDMIADQFYLDDKISAVHSATADTLPPSLLVTSVE